MKTFLLLLLACTALHAAPPNIVLIVADDLGYADVGCNGAKDIRTPNIDALAKQGTRFTNFNVAQAVCTASRAGFLTGCYPNRLGMGGALNHTTTVGIHPDETLLSEVCQSKGYSTTIFGKWHLGTRPMFHPLKHGFNAFFGLPYSNDNGPRHPTVAGMPPLPLFDSETVIERDPDQSQFTKRFTEKAVAFIAANKTKPFFLYVPHVMPHVPIAAAKEQQGRSQRGLYGDVVEELDDSIGTIVRALKDNGLEENTIVLFFSDNGPFLSYGNHAGLATPFREGKLTTFEGGVRVPFLVKWPGHVPANRVCDEYLTGLELMPTLAKLIDAPLRHKVDGLDLSALWLGQPDAKGRDTFAYYSGSELQAVRNGNWKLHLPHDYLTVDGPPGHDGKPANFGKINPKSITDSGLGGIASRHGYRVEKIDLSLFDLRNDPGESVNLAAKHPEIVKNLQSLAEAFRKDLGDSITKSKGQGLRAVGRDEPPKEPKP